MDHHPVRRLAPVPGPVAVFHVNRLRALQQVGPDPAEGQESGQHAHQEEDRAQADGQHPDHLYPEHVEEPRVLAVPASRPGRRRGPQGVRRLRLRPGDAPQQGGAQEDCHRDQEHPHGVQGEPYQAEGARTGEDAGGKEAEDPAKQRRTCHPPRRHAPGADPEQTG